MNNRDVRREVHALAWPMVGTNFLIRGINIIDMILVGHLGKEALAGVGIAQMVLFVGMMLTFSISVGATVMVAYFTGAGDGEKRNRIIKTSLTIAAGVGIGLTIPGELLSVSAAKWIGAESAVLDLAWDYLHILWFFYVFKILQFVLSSIFQGMGDSKTPLYIIGVSNFLHVIAAYALIYGKFGAPELGVEGAAIATGCSEALSAVVMFLMLIRRRDVSLSVPFSDKSDLRRLVKLSSPVVGERFLTISMQWTYNAIILHTTVAAYAAHQAGMQIESLSFLPGIAFMQAATALVGKNLGANNVEDATRSGYQSNLIAMIIMGLFGLTFFFLPEQWMRVFTSDPEVIEYGITFCRIVAILQVPLAASLVLGGALRGAGETKWVMIATFIGAWGIRIPLALAAYWLNWGIFWIWMAMTFDWFIRAGLFFWRYSRGGWKLAENGVPARAA